jgi:hypothetical protein
VEFLLPIPVSLFGAIAWFSWQRRRAEKRPLVTVEEYQRALAALARHS